MILNRRKRMCFLYRHAEKGTATRLYPVAKREKLIPERCHIW